MRSRKLWPRGCDCREGGASESLGVAVEIRQLDV